MAQLQTVTSFKLSLSCFGGLAINVNRVLALCATGSRRNSGSGLTRSNFEASYPEGEGETGPDCSGQRFSSPEDPGVDKVVAEICGDPLGKKNRLNNSHLCTKTLQWRPESNRAWSRQIWRFSMQMTFTWHFVSFETFDQNRQKMATSER